MITKKEAIELAQNSLSNERSDALEYEVSQHIRQAAEKGMGYAVISQFWHNLTTMEQIHVEILLKKFEFGLNASGPTITVTWE